MFYKFRDDRQTEDQEPGGRFGEGEESHPGSPVSLVFGVKDFDIYPDGAGTEDAGPRESFSKVLIRRGDKGEMEMNR